MPAHASPAVRASRYRQVRLTFTQEGHGGLSYSVYAKGLNQAWNEHQCLVRARLQGFDVSLLSTEDVLTALLAILDEHLISLREPTQ